MLKGRRAEAGEAAAGFPTKTVGNEGGLFWFLPIFADFSGEMPVFPSAAGVSGLELSQFKFELPWFKSELSWFKSELPWFKSELPWFKSELSWFKSELPCPESPLPRFLGGVRGFRLEGRRGAAGTGGGRVLGDCGGAAQLRGGRVLA